MYLDDDGCHEIYFDDEKWLEHLQVEVGELRQIPKIVKNIK